MISKIEKIEKLLNEKRVLNKNNLYSQILKNERTNRRFTLSKLSKGICSISYLCKFERNAIEADESYIRMIFERINLDYDKVGQNIIKDGVNRCIKAYLYMNYEHINSIYDEIDDSIFNAQNFLIKGFYFLVKGDYVNFSEVITSLDNIKETLCQEDLGVLLFLVIEYYLNTYQFEEAKRYLEFLINKNFENEDLNWLIWEQHFNAGYNLKNYPVLYRYYFKLMANYSIGYPSARQLIIRLKVLSLEATVYYEEISKELKNISYSSLPANYMLEINYWKYITMVVGGEWVDVHDLIINNALYADAKIMGLLYYTAYLIHDELIIKEVMEISNKFSFEEIDAIHIKFINFMNLFFTSDKSYSIVDYLKKNIMPYNKTYMHHLYSKVYNEIYMDYLLKTSKYKEAYKLVRD